MRGQWGGMDGVVAGAFLPTPRGSSPRCEKGCGLVAPSLSHGGVARLDTVDTAGHGARGEDLVWGGVGECGVHGARDGVRRRHPRNIPVLGPFLGYIPHTLHPLPPRPSGYPMTGGEQCTLQLEPHKWGWDQNPPTQFRGKKRGSKNTSILTMAGGGAPNRTHQRREKTGPKGIMWQPGGTVGMLEAAQ